MHSGLEWGASYPALIGSLEVSGLTSREKVLRKHATLFLGLKSNSSVDGTLPIDWFSCWLPEASFLHCPSVSFALEWYDDVLWGDQKDWIDSWIDGTDLRVSVTLRTPRPVPRGHDNGLCPYGRHRSSTGRCFAELLSFQGLAPIENGLPSDWGIKEANEMPRLAGF